jgi:Mn2+/Fe2+ NRAMP family transporter
LLALLVLLLRVLLGRALIGSGRTAGSIRIGLDRRRVVTWALGRSRRRRSRRCHRVTTAIPKLFVALALGRRSWCQTGVLVRVLSSFSEIGIEVEDLEDSLGVSLIILFGDGR